MDNYSLSALCAIFGTIVGSFLWEGFTKKNYWKAAEHSWTGITAIALYWILLRLVPI